MKKSKKWKEL